MTDEQTQQSSATLNLIHETSRVIQKLESLDTRVATTQSSLNNDLPSDSRAVFEIFSNLEHLILNSDESNDDEEFFMPSLDDVSHLAIVSQSVLSYVKNISPGSRLMKIANNIYTQVTSWIASLFLKEAVAAFLPTNTDCLAKALRLALTCKFENYIKDGIQGTKSCSIYIVQSNPYLPDLKFATHLIGLSQSTIKFIPTSEGTDTIIMADLEMQISADKAADVVPLFLIADFGSSFAGSSNGALTDFYEVTLKHSLWLHITGPLITAFAIAQGQAEITKPISSMSLDLESWLGLPTTPTVLLHRQFPALKQGVFEIESDMRKLDAFPLWTVIQNLGRNKIVTSFGNAFQSCQLLHEMVSKTRGFKVISRAPAPVSSKENFSLEAFASIVLFQFDGTNMDTKQVNANGEVVEVRAIEKVNHASYFDRLNSWLGQTLERDFPQIQLTLMEHSHYGTCIRYSPFELSTGEKVPSLETFTEFYEFFETQSDILRSTIQKKQTFIDLVEKSDVLKLVELNDHWAGLGGVYYVPLNMEKMETDQEKTELNRFNVQLVEKLRSSDNAFSLGESTDGVACIRFGMVTSETDIEELLDLVSSAGGEIQESSKALDSMAEVIKAGIQAAQKDLQKEADEKLWNDGILRVVPVVGNVLNWINPLPRDGGGSGIRGRTLNLSQGVVESTENTYKYHVQLPLNQPTGKGSNNHSRNGSHSSTNSKQGVQPMIPAPAVVETPVEEEVESSSKPAA